MRQINIAVLASQLQSLRSSLDANLVMIERTHEGDLPPVYYQLASMRLLIDSMLYYVAGEDPAEDFCEHKERMNLTTMGGKVHWICKTCGYEYLEG